MRGNHPLAGATLANLSPALVEELGIDAAPRGVIVLELRRGSPANQIRLQPGDILVQINDREVRSVEDARRIASSTAMPWRMTLRRGGRAINLTVGG
jgi:serine protease Do